VIIGLLILLVIPAVRTPRTAARRMSCGNNLKQLGLAILSYEGTHGHLPPAMGGTGRGRAPHLGNANRLSGLVALLPFMEQEALWELISAPSEADGVAYPAMGPEPSFAQYQPWQIKIEILYCPSDAKPDATEFGTTSYGFSIGDQARNIHQPTALRGAFGGSMTSTLDEITDGMSNTLAMIEFGAPSRRRVAGQFATFQPASILDRPSQCRDTVNSRKPNFYISSVKLGTPGRGGRWADGAAGVGLINTILPPNSPSCASGGDDGSSGL
jgi:hypothetical protein